MLTVSDTINLRFYINTKIEKETTVLIKEIYDLFVDISDRKNLKAEKEFNQYIKQVFDKTEQILKNYLDMFSDVRIKIISQEVSVEEIIDYLMQREYELKTVRIYIRSLLSDSYYKSDDILLRFVSAVYGIMECYPVKSGVIIDKTNHTIHSYIHYCELLLCEDSQIQKTKILKMTDGILKDLTTSWETVCYCYNELIREK